MKKSYHDHIFQNIKLYVEGVQIPFTSISITSGIGGLPTANISVPAQAGLMDIGRFYSPKVHIFYSDRMSDYDPSDLEEMKSQDKLLFSGLIAQVSYHKSKDVGASVGISFSCVHRYNLVNEMLIDYSGWLGGDILDPNEKEAAIKADTANSKSSVITALAGITRKHDSAGTPAQQELTEDNPDGKVTTLPEDLDDYYNRLIGMPGVMVNFWNQMKRSAFNRSLKEGNAAYSESFIKMYQPLVEGGLHFFERLGGHYPIEAFIQADINRVDPCPDVPGTREAILIPPVNQMFLASSVQAQMTVSNVASYLQASGEVTSIYGIFNEFYSSIDYDLITLTSPAEVPIRADVELSADAARNYAAITGDSSVLADAETHALDTIVKPRMPFYFSPSCNVLFPGMYTSLSVMYDELNVPTRVNVKNVEGSGDGNFRTNFRAPASIREAIAAKVAGVNGGTGYDKTKRYSLLATTGPSLGAIGVYEQGRGIKLENMQMPRWLSMFSQSTFGANSPTTDSASSQQNRRDAMAQLAKGWARRYPGDPIATLNPYTIEDSDISAHHRILFTSADYYYTQVFARSKMGRVECPFNPFITPGYPMDILEANPTYPSFHAMCISVTHTFTATSMNTSVDFSAAMTYSELNNYYIPFVNPMLQVSLGLAENPTLVGQGEGSTALATADEFYRYTLGCNAVAPDEVLDFNTMGLKPKKMDSDGKWVEGSDAPITGPNGGDRNPMRTYEGMLSMVQRPIEDKAKIEERFDIKFIDMDYNNYDSTVIKYKNSDLEDSDKYEIGQSQFLKYDTFFGDELVKQDTSTVAKSTDSSDGTAVTVTTDVNGKTQSVKKGM